jgi:hypothetical protein
MMPTPDLATVVARLEKENRNLLSRVEKLEKRRGSSIPALIANVLLLVSAGLLASYLGLLPPAVDRLPLAARTVEAEEFILRPKDGPVRARVALDEKGFRVIDEKGKSLLARP